uniref:Uncharacterized protein n=1 Tax=virus sp. ctn3M15 TaxID=2825821 RepID=A0A8S5RLP6_9VIRU|nr:MAG TPA: hypothetical protein [virus sp. ctn3M15]
MRWRDVAAVSVWTLCVRLLLLLRSVRLRSLPCLMVRDGFIWGSLMKCGVRLLIWLV